MSFLVSGAGCSGFLYQPDSHNYLMTEHSPYRVVRSSLEPESGTRLDFWEASRGEKRPAACVLLVHGNGQNASAHIHNVLWMADRGVRVYSFDYRGYGASTGSPDPENTVKDTIWVLHHVAKICSPIPLVGIGQSLGGAILLRALSEMPSPLPLNAVILDSTFLSYRRVSVDVLSRFWLTWPFQWLGWLVMSDTWAPISRIEKVPEIPMLVLHGTKDPVIPFRFGQEVFEKVPVKQKRFLTIPDGRHTEGFFSENGKFRPDILDWIQLHTRSNRVRN